MDTVFFISTSLLARLYFHLSFLRYLIIKYSPVYIKATIKTEAVKIVPIFGVYYPVSADY